MITNQVILLGYVGTDPQFKKTSKNQFFIKFSLATHESFKDKNGILQTQTHWHPISVWGEDLALHLFETIHKGDKVRVEGKLKSHQWTDAQGKTRTSYEILINPFFGSCLLLPFVKKAEKIQINIEIDDEKEEENLAPLNHLC